MAGVVVPWLFQLQFLLNFRSERIKRRLLMIKSGKKRESLLNSLERNKTLDIDLEDEVVVDGEAGVEELKNQVLQRSILF